MHFHSSFEKKIQIVNKNESSYSNSTRRVASQTFPISFLQLSDDIMTISLNRTQFRSNFITAEKKKQRGKVKLNKEESRFDIVRKEMGAINPSILCPPPPRNFINEKHSSARN